MVCSTRFASRPSPCLELSSIELITGESVSATTPETIRTEIRQILGSVYEADYVTVPAVSEEAAAYASEKEIPVVIRGLKEEMKQAAKALEFERAAELRDRIRDLTKLMVEMGGEG